MGILDTALPRGAHVLGHVKRIEQRCHIKLHNVGQVCSKHHSGWLILP